MYVHCCQTVWFRILASPSGLARVSPGRRQCLPSTPERFPSRCVGSQHWSYFQNLATEAHRQVKLLLGLQISILGRCLVGKDWAPSPGTPWSPGPHCSRREVPSNSPTKCSAWVSETKASGQGFLQRNPRLVATGPLCNLIGHNQ